MADLELLRTLDAEVYEARRRIAHLEKPVRRRLPKHRQQARQSEIEALRKAIAYNSQRISKIVNWGADVQTVYLLDG